VPAAVREAREEIGDELRPDDVAVVGTMHRKSGDERVDFFGTVRRLDALPPNTIPYIRRAVERSTDDALWFEEFGW
jgi:8-oxo-dGTP diphosphatase